MSESSFSIESKFSHLACSHYRRFEEKKTRKKRTSEEKDDEERTRAIVFVASARPLSAPLHRLMVLWVPLSKLARRFATIGCSGKDGKSAQGDGGLSIRNDDDAAPACID